MADLAARLTVIGWTLCQGLNLGQGLEGLLFHLGKERGLRSD